MRGQESLTFNDVPGNLRSGGRAGIQRTRRVTDRLWEVSDLALFEADERGLERAA